MREKLLKKNIVIMDKLTNEKFLVTGVTPVGFTILPVADEEINLLLNKELTLNDFSERTDWKGASRKDLILYRYVRDVQPAAIPDLNQYSVDNNGFIVSGAGKVTEQGDLRFKTIIGAIPNALVLVDKDDNLVVYNLRRDRFATILSPKTEETQEVSYTRIDIAAQEPYFAAYANVYETVEEEGENGEKVEVKKPEESFFIKEGSDGFIRSLSFQDEITSAGLDVNDNLLVIRRTGTDLKGEVSLIYFPDGTVEAYDGRAVNVKKANGFITVRESDGGLQVIEAGKYFDETINIPELDGFYAFDKDYDGNLFFVDANRVIKKLISKQTSDRGTIYTVEDVN